MMDQEAERIVKEAFDEVEKEEGLEEDEEDRGGNDMFPPIPRDDAGAASPDRIKELLAQHPDPFDGKGPKTDEEIQAFLENPPEELRGDIERMQAELQKLESELAREFEDEMGDPLEEPLGRRERPGLLAMGDDDEMEMGDDELDEGDDMTSLGHGDLERHREMRDYARLIAWDMPLLSSMSSLRISFGHFEEQDSEKLPSNDFLEFAKPFEPPTPETPLRFRFTSYMGETHPAEPKVVVEFCTADLPLEPRQRLKLVKLLGARYDPQQDLARMSCEQFRHAAQNKRYLVDLVNTLVTEARCQSDAEGGRDAFDDVPVDFRHVKWKKRLAFPEEWKMTPERKARLQEGWRRIEEEDKKRLEERTLVDGVLVIEKSREKLGAGAMPRNLRLPQGKPAGRGARQAKPEYAYAR